MAGDSEPFPALNTGAEQLHQTINTSDVRRRRKSSGLGQEIRAGDTGAPGLSTGLAYSLSKTDGKRHHSKRRKARSFMRRATSFAIKHTWVLPFIILSIFGALYAVNPTESNPVHHFIFLSYKLPASSSSSYSDKDGPDAIPQYGKGHWDLAFVAFYTVVLSFTREFIMQELLRPLAKFFGLRSRGKQSRFMEQMYTAIYFAFLGPAGLYVMSRTPVWYFNTRGMYEYFPHKTHEACFKFYYLFQAAYWAQQAIVLVLGQEARRKDFRELVGHHIVSLALIGLSYRFHFTYIGLAVYITHDISDFFLATSKCLNYIDGPLMGPYYFTFMCIWIYLRHYLNIRIIISLLTEFRTVGPYELDWEAGQYKCLLSNVITLTLLSALQALNLFWLFFILRIAYRFAFLNIAKDDRSDESEPETDQQQQQDEAKKQAQLPAARNNPTFALTDTDADTTKVLLANGVTTRSKANGGAAKRR